MPTTLPIPWATSCPRGSEWIQAFQLLNDDGSNMDISTSTFEFVLRDAATSTGTPAAIITTAMSTALGQITVDTGTATITAVLTPTATKALAAADTYALALWLNPGQPSATALVLGGFYVQPAAAP